MTDEIYENHRSAIEALLFVSDEPVSAGTIADMVGIEPKEVDEILSQLSVDYREENRGFQLREVAGGWRLYTHPAHHEIIEKYVLSWDTRKLSQAALEALAVVAYNQPVTRAGVNAIRGVNSEGVVSSLIEKGLVREMGHDKGPGNAILYGTTRTFLEKFGLKSLKDLPPLEDFAPDEESKQFIRERLSAGSLAVVQPDLDDEDEGDFAGLYTEGDAARALEIADGVEEYDSGADGAVEDPEAMAAIIAEGMTEKVTVDEFSLDDDDDFDDPENLELVD